MTVQPNISVTKRQADHQSQLSLGLNAHCGGANRRFEFHKRSQLFVGANNETLSVVAMSIGNEDRSPVTIHGCNAAPTPSSFAQIVSDDLAVIHAGRI